MQIGHITLIFLLAVYNFQSSALATSRASFLFNNGGYGSNLLHLPSDLPSFKEAPSFKNGQECPPFHTQETLCDPLSVHIVMTLDASYLRGTMAAILSIVQHMSCPENVVFHFLASTMESSLSESIRHTFPYLRFNIHHFNEDLVTDRISTSVRQALEQPLNYARIFVAEMLPSCIDRVIYLDSDVIVVDDIVKLWSTNLNGHTIGAPEYCHANFTTYFNDAFWNDRSLSMILDDAEREPCYFNTGVMVIDLHQWRQEAYTQRLLVWMDIQKEKRIYELGSLPPFLLVFGGNVEPIEHRWNQHGLGGDNQEGRCRSLHEGPVSLLHWSGKGKPWVRLDAQRPCPLDSLWAPYDLAIPSDGENMFVQDN